MSEEEKTVDATPEAAQPQEAAAAPETSETQEETAEQQQDRVLMELDGDPDPDDLIPAGDVSEETEPQAGEPQGDRESETSPLSEQHKQAYDILKRDGWTPEDLEALSDDRLLSIAEHRKKMQADVDRMLRERQAPSPDTETDKDSGEATAEPTSDQPSVANLAEQATAFAEYLGLDESGKALLVELQQAAVQPMQKLVQEQQRVLQAVQEQLLFTELERARMSLVDRYPQARDTQDERWGKVLDRMGQMWADGAQHDPGKMMEEAILLEYRGEIAEQARDAKERVANYRQAGMPSVKPRPEATPTYSTPEERQDAVLRILESNDPDKYARARAIGKPNL